MDAQALSGPTFKRGEGHSGLARAGGTGCLGALSEFAPAPKNQWERGAACPIKGPGSLPHHTGVGRSLTTGRALASFPVAVASRQFGDN